jgi:hypothetical protein
MTFGMTAVTMLLMLVPVIAASAQEPYPNAGGTDRQAHSVRSNLVIVPTLVKTKKGDVVFSLRGEDFSLTDNGVPQRVQLDTDADAQPLALVIVAQTGGQGAIHLEDYRGLGSMLEAIIGAVPHEISVVSFDSQVHLEQGFNEAVEISANVLGRSRRGIKGWLSRTA